LHEVKSTEKDDMLACLVEIDGTEHLLKLRSDTYVELSKKDAFSRVERPTTQRKREVGEALEFDGHSDFMKFVNVDFVKASFELIMYIARHENNCNDTAGDFVNLDKYMEYLDALKSAVPGANVNKRTYIMMENVLPDRARAEIANMVQSNAKMTVSKKAKYVFSYGERDFDSKEEAANTAIEEIFDKIENEDEFEMNIEFSKAKHHIVEIEVDETSSSESE
jgi:hypothetical protein